MSSTFNPTATATEFVPQSQFGNGWDAHNLHAAWDPSANAFNGASDMNQYQNQAYTVSDSISYAQAEAYSAKVRSPIEGLSI